MGVGWVIVFGERSEVMAPWQHMSRPGSHTLHLLNGRVCGVPSAIVHTLSKQLNHQMLVFEPHRIFNIYTLMRFIYLKCIQKLKLPPEWLRHKNMKLNSEVIQIPCASCKNVKLNMWTNILTWINGRAAMISRRLINYWNSWQLIYRVVNINTITHMIYKKRINILICINAN